MINPLRSLINPRKLVRYLTKRKKKPDPARVLTAVDFPRLQASHVLVVGTGGCISLIKDLVRTGVGRVTAMDFDEIASTNVCSQDCGCKDIGCKKVDVLGNYLLDINPDLHYVGLDRDFLTLTEEEIAHLVKNVDLVLAMTDSFKAQARANRVSLKYGIPTLFAIIYSGGEALEVTWNLPGTTTACHRCVTAGRYRAYDQGFQDETGSSGATVFSGHILNGVLGMLSLGILLQGLDTRFSNWMRRLGDRNFLQMRLSPDFVLQGENGPNDVFGRHLGNGPHLFAFDSIYLPPDDPPAYDSCPDCGSTGDLRDAADLVESTIPVFDSGQPMVEDPGQTWRDRATSASIPPRSRRVTKPIIQIPRHIYDEIYEEIGRQPAETGGMLVGDLKDPFSIRLFHHDPRGSIGAHKYDPDYQGLNRALKKLYRPNGLDMVGFVHSHPAGVRSPSGDWGNNIGDIAYARANLKSDPDMEVFLMPIVMTLPDSGRFEMLGYVVFQDDPDRAVEAEIHIV